MNGSQCTLLKGGLKVIKAECYISKAIETIIGNSPTLTERRTCGENEEHMTTATLCVMSLSKPKDITYFKETSPNIFSRKQIYLVDA